MQNDLKNVLKIFPKDKTELESQKIELTTVDDLRKLTDSVSQLGDETTRWVKPVREKTNQINNAKEDIRDILDANPTINGYVNSFHDCILAFQQMDKKAVDRIKQYIGESTEDRNLFNFAIKNMFSVADRS